MKLKIRRLNNGKASAFAFTQKMIELPCLNYNAISLNIQAIVTSKHAAAKSGISC